MDITFNPIGIIHTPFLKKEDMPIQSSFCEGVRGTVVLQEKYIKGLQDLDGFSHLYLIYFLHLSSGFDLQVIPFLDNKPRGVFATRAPRRPNAIGISVVRLIGIKGNILEIENVDMLDGTPLLDIKPFISRFDIHQTDKEGWIQDKAGNPGKVKSDGRFK